MFFAIYSSKWYTSKQFNKIKVKTEACFGCLRVRWFSQFQLFRLFGFYSTFPMTLFVLLVNCSPSVDDSNHLNTQMLSTATRVNKSVSSSMPSSTIPLKINPIKSQQNTLKNTQNNYIFNIFYWWKFSILMSLPTFTRSLESAFLRGSLLRGFRVALHAHRSTCVSWR